MQTLLATPRPSQKTSSQARQQNETRYQTLKKEGSTGVMILVM